MRKPRVFFSCVLSLPLALLLGSGVRAQPFADDWVSYVQGANVSPAFIDPTAALGMPALNNGTDPDFGDVNPFNGAFLGDQLVQIGDGGELVVKFEDPVLDEPGNPFGIDLLVFGNAFFFQPDLFGPIAEDVFADNALISVSQFEAGPFHDITSVFADGLFPTSAFLDSPSPFVSGGTVLSDFTKPVDPDIAWFGKTFEEIVALYNGSGGGAGVDISEVGLEWIQYVRIQPRNGVTAEIDAFSDVAALPLPEPSVAALAALGLLALGWRSLQTSRP